PHQETDLWYAHAGNIVIFDEKAVQERLLAPITENGAVAVSKIQVLYRFHGKPPYKTLIIALYQLRRLSRRRFRRVFALVNAVGLVLSECVSNGVHESLAALISMLRIFGECRANRVTLHRS